MRLALLEGLFRHASGLQIGEGEEHAPLIGELDRLPRQYDEPPASIGYWDLGFYLRHRLPGCETLGNIAATLHAAKQIEFHDRPADECLFIEAGQFVEAGIGANERLV